MKVVRTKAEVREATGRMRRAGERIAFVPTMGYLHRGHASLLERAKRGADRVVLSIFVNPIQFGPTEDLDRYPRDLDRDLDMARSMGVDLVFTPEPREMYPGGEPETTVDPGPMGSRLCGAFRPEHFRGVLTVVAKLFAIVRPDVAIFGRKDFQQFVLIRRMAHDLDLDVEIVGAPIAREEDGLAMSSRNAMLSEDERREAAGIHRALRRLMDRFDEGERRSEALLEAFRDELAARPTLRLQYAELVHPDTLAPVERAEAGTVAAVAAFAGQTRLIDNVALGVEGGAGEEVGETRHAASEGSPPLPPVVRQAGHGVFPEWVRAGDERKEHMRRVASLMSGWAEGLGLAPDEVLRWKAAGILHDALREEEPEVLRAEIRRGGRPELAEWDGPLLHGPAAAVRLREEGVDDEFLSAITFHTTGHPDLGRMGRALYAADFLEPGRPILREWRAARRARMPAALDDVVRELLEVRIAHFVKSGRPVRPETAAFWAEVTAGRPLPDGSSARDDAARWIDDAAEDGDAQTEGARDADDARPGGPGAGTR